MINDESNHKEPDCDTKPSEGEIDEASERSASSDDYKETTSHPGWKGFHKNPEHVFGACITVFTLFLTASTVYQACAMRDQSVPLVKSNNINHEALVTVQRAFVFPKPTLAPFKYDEGRKVGLGFFVTWENSGSTPTRDLTININSGSFDQIPKGDMFKDSGDKIDTPMVIGPKATIFSDPVTWDADQLATIQTGEKILFVWGRARYKDRFEDTTIHRTRFVYKI